MFLIWTQIDLKLPFLASQSFVKKLLDFNKQTRWYHGYQRYLLHFCILKNTKKFLTLPPPIPQLLGVYREGDLELAEALGIAKLSKNQTSTVFLAPFPIRDTQAPLRAFEKLCSQSPPLCI